MSFCLSLKDMQPTEYDGSIPMYMDKKIPTDTDILMQPFDIVRITLMPKNEDGLKKPRKSCFTFKSMGPTMRTMSSILPLLKETMHKSKQDAEEDSLMLIRGEGKYSPGLPYAHQVDCMPPKEDKENYAASEITTCSFLEHNIGSEVTFMYDDTESLTIRMCIKPTTGNTPYSVDMPRHVFLKNANAKDLHTACGFYTLAAHCPNALYAFVMHGRFWGRDLWDPSCLYGEATPFRGVPIVDISKLLSPLVRSDFYVSANVDGEGKKAKISIPLGFKMPYSGGNTADEDDDDTALPLSTSMCAVHAQVAIAPRKITEAVVGVVNPYSISTDMRLSPHGCVPMELGYVMTIYLATDAGKHNILNLDYNGARDVGCTPAIVAGKRHAWSSAVPCVIDDEEVDEVDSGEADQKRAKKAMDACA